MKWIVGGVLAALVVIGGCGGCVYQTSIKTNDEPPFTVESKERIAEENDGKWMVYATDGREFQVADNWLHGLTDATERYRELEEGHAYKCKTIGVRWPLLSEYRNLYDCEAI